MSYTTEASTTELPEPLPTPATASSAVAKNYFSGVYVQVVRDALVASSLSGVHALLIGGAGTGKTAISTSVGQDIFGHTVAIRLDETTPPEKITGPIDMTKLLAEQATVEFVRQGTPYEEGLRCAILDEVGRASGPIFSLLMDVLDRLDIPEQNRYPVWSTSNFMPQGDKYVALLDRIGIWVWVNGEKQNIANFIAARANALSGQLHVPGTLPTLQDIEAAYAAVPGPKALAAITRLLENLTNEVDADSSGHKFAYNNRRLSQWFQILFRCGYWYSGGNADFDTVPDQAVRALMYAYPNTSPAMAAAWENLIAPLADQVGAVIDQIMTQAYNFFQQFCEKNTTAKSRIDNLTAIGTELSKAQDNLYHATPNAETNERVQEAISRLTNVYAQIMSGQNPLNKK